MKKLTEKSILLLIITGCFLAFLIFRVYKNISGTRVTGQKQLIVSTELVKTSKTQTVLEFIGTAVSNESVDITSSITQKVSQINFSDCDFVKKGDVLVQLNVEKQKAVQKQAEINLQEQQRELIRLSSLKDKKIIAEKEYDLQNTKLQDAQAKLAEVEEEIKEGTIVAPFDGMLGIRKISVGSLLTPGTIITTIDDIKKIKVDFPVPEKYLSLINKDCKITATSIAIPNKKFYGVVQAISPRISPTSRSISVRGIIENEEYLLRPGMMLNVTMQMQDRNVLLIPENSISNVGEKHFVFLIEDGNRVKQKEVEIGQRLSGFVEIISGLKAGDSVVTDGVVKISDGDIVEISSRHEKSNNVAVGAS